MLGAFNRGLDNARHLAKLASDERVNHLRLVVMFTPGRRAKLASMFL